MTDAEHEGIVRRAGHAADVKQCLDALDSARAEIERLRAGCTACRLEHEQDTADRVELDACYRVLNGYSEGEPHKVLEQVIAENQHLRSSLAALESVWTAAKEWRAVHERPTAAKRSVSRALWDAIVAALAEGK